MGQKHSIRPAKFVLTAFYFWFSLTFLICRTAFVSLCASKIYDESKKPLKILRSIPGKFYKNEAKRFLELIVNTQAALSGMNFFHITRKFMLSVAGTIVTYELVLIQLHFTFDTEGGQDPCG
ncbi:gustatory receptor for sugar taste 64f-like [Condylostylus longicornis]|uniref:gustatory receptor for sugar taste 64f-like n=1 Tax=Condylostylus longicornis TaxID=2530218 RepID=UPI00244E57FB|nr:gustatory receptor for sugar taste 64f-like [Condylostylus longicornis]